MRVLIIIPAYNEEKSILSTVESVKELGYNYIVINDGSKDNTELICRQNDLNFVSLPINLGIGGGVQTGYKYALENDYDIAVQIDGDGQHNPAFIKEVIEPIIQKECDMVIGSRFAINDKNGFKSTFFRRLGINFLSFTIKIVASINIKDVTSGFRAVNRNLIHLFAEQYAQDFPEPESIVLAVQNNYSVIEIPVVMNERQHGVSSINPMKSIYYMVKVSLAIVLSKIVYIKVKE